MRMNRHETYGRHRQSGCLCWPFLIRQGCGVGKCRSDSAGDRYTEPGLGDELTTGKGCSVISCSEPNPVELADRLAAAEAVSQ